ncbi:EscU/YscU/HrcU family type III secretion system export apparatus switch protein [Horticoccus sp. 23ND18S-11]|uniref:EscU/YscU/HrcU family type III secretion system export apparatus switch protein n=1 Tax=Horticoccus sp. 23ND18S-11 TaxID=3391832 RepID=UPI0039C9A34D
MSDHDQDQKTEQASEKKLSEAAERGQFAKSHELTVLFPLAAVLGVLTLTAQSASRDVSEYAVSMFTNFATTSLSSDTVTVQIGDAMATFGRAIAPFLVAVVIAVLLASGAQSGFQLSPKAIGFKLENLDPIAGFGRVFSKTALVHSCIDLLKLGAIGSALWLGARGLMHDPLFSAPVEAAYLGQFINSATILFLTRLLFALGIVAAISFGYEKFKTSREMMMTREEVKEERRQSEGDAMTKAAMRRMARRLMQTQMLDAVKTADVVVTNPTHFAVALKYERGVDQAPVVLAKGENRFAQRIKAIAAENGVPMVENKPVARLLFAMGKVGETIPGELYQAVAAILAVVYRTHRYYFHRLKARRMEASA